MPRPASASHANHVSQQKQLPHGRRRPSSGTVQGSKDGQRKAVCVGNKPALQNQPQLKGALNKQVHLEVIGAGIGPAARPASSGPSWTSSSQDSIANVVVPVPPGLRVIAVGSNQPRPGIERKHANGRGYLDAPDLVRSPMQVVGQPMRPEMDWQDMFGDYSSPVAESPLRYVTAAQLPRRRASGGLPAALGMINMFKQPIIHVSYLKCTQVQMFVWHYRAGYHERC